MLMLPHLMNLIIFAEERKCMTQLIMYFYRCYFSLLGTTIQFNPLASNNPDLYSSIMESWRPVKIVVHFCIEFSI